MVKDISHQKINYKLGLLSIPVDDLIGILERKSTGKISAKNETTEFENLTDIKEHKALFAGAPSIFVDDVFISFESQWGSIYSYGSDPKDATTAKSLYEEFIRYKSFLDKFTELKILSIGYYIPIATFLFCIIIFHEKLGIGAEYSNILFWPYIIYSFAFLMKGLWMGYSAFLRQAVYYTPTQGLLQRNFEKIAVGVIMGVFGVLAGSLGPKLLEATKAWF
ncbi:hypothetical protein AB9E28_10420 [Rhizobium leguminosarum]|uniref:hypothetical protein n=1 Tax=Rhizobium leguminosarum TaxID=384 RepID=UPI003F967AEF